MTKYSLTVNIFDLPKMIVDSKAVLKLTISSLIVYIKSIEPKINL